MSGVDTASLNHEKCMICQDPEGDTICIECLRDERKGAAFRRIAFLEVNGKLPGYEREEIIKKYLSSTPHEA